jgi:flagellin-specific chaperone FliS
MNCLKGYHFYLIDDIEAKYNIGTLKDFRRNLQKLYSFMSAQLVEAYRFRRHTEDWNVVSGIRSLT